MAAVEVSNTPKAPSGVNEKDGTTLEQILSEDYAKNPLLQPTNKTADEIVAEIMAEVSDEGVLSSLKRMGELHEELESKIKNYQTSFDDQMKGIQADIEKYWQTDKEYEQYHKKLDELCAEDGQKKPASQQIKEMMEAFKEGKYKEGLEMVTAVDPNVISQGRPLSALNGLNQSHPDVSTEEVFSDASSEASVTEGKAKSPRVKKPEESKGKKGQKKKTIKS